MRDRPTRVLVLLCFLLGSCVVGRPEAAVSPQERLVPDFGTATEAAADDASPSPTSTVLATTAPLQPPPPTSAIETAPAPATTTSTPAPAPTTSSPSRSEPTADASRPDGAVPSSDAAPVELRGDVTDPTGDQSSRLAGAPAHADLVAATLLRRDDEFELVFRVAAALPASQDGEFTNLASFYDLDGDGNIDYEVWASLGPDGWGTSYYDNVTGSARFGDQDDVTVEPGNTEVRLLFPAAHLADATSLRWSTASEHGRPEELGTQLAARDFAPDEGRPAAWPG